MFDAQVIMSSLLVGAAVATGGFFSRPYFSRALDRVENDLADKLRGMRMKTTRVRKWIVVWLTVIASVCAMLWVYFDSLIFPFMAASLMSCVPWFLLRRMAQKRRDAIEDQLADGMATFSSAIKAGLSLAQALELLAEQGPKPMCDEFRQIVGEYNMGKPLDRSLTEAKERLRSENFALFSAALLASRESGGRLNETVDRISRSVLEMQRLERKIQAETAQARASAVYMALAPAPFLAGFYFLDPIATSRLFVTVPGQLLLSTSLILDIAAYFWARKILNPDI